MNPSVPELTPVPKRPKPLPIGLALAFLLVPAGAYLYVHRSAWLPAPSPPRAPVERPAASAPAPREDPDHDAAAQAAVEKILADLDRKKQEEAAAETVKPPKEAPDADLLKEADRLLDEAEKKLKGNAGVKPSQETTRGALQLFERARDGFRKYASLHPERERSIAPRLQRANANILWCRKELPVDLGERK